MGFVQVENSYFLISRVLNKTIYCAVWKRKRAFKSCHGENLNKCIYLNFLRIVKKKPLEPFKSECEIIKRAQLKNSSTLIRFNLINKTPPGAPFVSCVSEWFDHISNTKQFSWHIRLSEMKGALCQNFFCWKTKNVSLLLCNLFLNRIKNTLEQTPCKWMRTN